MFLVTKKYLNQILLQWIKIIIVDYLFKERNDWKRRKIKYYIVVYKMDVYLMMTLQEKNISTRPVYILPHFSIHCY